MKRQLVVTVVSAGLVVAAGSAALVANAASTSALGARDAPAARQFVG